MKDGNIIVGIGRPRIFGWVVGIFGSIVVVVAIFGMVQEIISIKDRHGGFAIFGFPFGDSMIPKHGKGRLDHFGFGGQIDPNLKKSSMIGLFLVDEGKHFAMHNAFSGGHPLNIAFSVSASVAQGIGMINDTINRGGDGFKSSQ